MSVEELGLSGVTRRYNARRDGDVERTLLLTVVVLGIVRGCARAAVVRQPEPASSSRIRP